MPHEEDNGKDESISGTMLVEDVGSWNHAIVGEHV